MYMWLIYFEGDYQNIVYADTEQGAIELARECYSTWYPNFETVAIIKVIKLN